MRSIHVYMMVIGLFIQTAAIAQIRSVTLQASGLTCSMCSRAIYKSLEKVSAVSDIKEDIEHSSYQIQFNDPDKISLENLKKAVTDAGFSVARMEVKASFSKVKIANDSSLMVNDFVFYFVGIKNQELDGERKLLILDKDFLSDKDRKKYDGSFSEGSDKNLTGKFYHVTLPKS